jgi:arginyl-tRNA synthetase
MEFDINLAKEQSLKNPVYYVQYGHARICSLIEYAERKGFKELNFENINMLNDDEEIKILKELYFFPEFLDDVLNNRTLHLLTSFLINLSSLYHNFYQKKRIVDGEKEKIVPRLLLSKGFKNVIRITLNLMGVGAPERM